VSWGRVAIVGAATVKMDRYGRVVEDSKYKPSCSARTADGFIRGALVGLAWGACFHPLEELASTGWVSSPVESELVGDKPKGGNAAKSTKMSMSPQARTSQSINPGQMLARVKSMGQASLMFGCFLGTFSGVTCACERITNSRSWTNVFVGGVAAGAVLASRNGSPQAIAVTGVATGLLTSFLHILTQG